MIQLDGAQRGPPTIKPVMPRRVLRAIVRQQYESERLIGWIQLVIVLTLAVLDMVTRSHEADRPTFHPVPVVLVAYALFTAVRLVLAYRNWLPRSFLMASAMADVVLLMVLIWALHLHYEQPAAFSLKTPTWGYVFIFIALRALRFEPRYVVVAGISAIVGWTVLVIFAILETPGSIVTDDVVIYAYRARVMLGAEIDKLLTIALVTIILALGLTRGRKLLVEAATGSEAARDLARFFSPTIVERITQADQPLLPGQGEVRDAAIVHVDIKGFTRLASALSADQTLRLLTGYQARVVPVVRAHGGAVDKFLGDGIMAVFVAEGDPASHARDALEAGLGIARAMAAWCPLEAAGLAGATAGLSPIRVSIGIADGQVVIGAVGAPGRLEFTVIGHPVNLASKLEKHTRIEPATVLVAGSTLDLAERQGFETPAGVVRRSARISGLEAPLPVAVLVP